VDKIIILSTVLANMAIPIFMAFDHHPRRGLARAFRWLLGYNLFYVIAVLYIVPRLAH
jgi:hypothetical protein